MFAEFRVVKELMLTDTPYLIGRWKYRENLRVAGEKLLLPHARALAPAHQTLPAPAVLADVLTAGQ